MNADKAPSLELTLHTDLTAEAAITELRGLLGDKIGAVLAAMPALPGHRGNVRLMEDFQAPQMVEAVLYAEGQKSDYTVIEDGYDIDTATGAVTRVNIISAKVAGKIESGKKQNAPVIYRQLMNEGVDEASLASLAPKLKDHPGQAVVTVKETDYGREMRLTLLGPDGQTAETVYGLELRHPFIIDRPLSKKDALRQLIAYGFKREMLESKMPKLMTHEGKVLMTYTSAAKAPGGVGLLHVQLLGEDGRTAVAIYDITDKTHVITERRR